MTPWETGIGFQSCPSWGSVAMSPQFWICLPTDQLWNEGFPGEGHEWPWQLKVITTNDPSSCGRFCILVLGGFGSAPQHSHTPMPIATSMAGERTKGDLPWIWRSFIHYEEFTREQFKCASDTHQKHIEIFVPQKYAQLLFINLNIFLKAQNVLK
jgi:hypothetical protein